MTFRGTGDTAHLEFSANSAVVATALKQRKEVAAQRLAGEGTGEMRKGGKIFHFQSMEDLRKKVPPRDWSKNEAAAESGDEEGREDNWPINVQFSERDWRGEEWKTKVVDARAVQPLEIFCSKNGLGDSGNALLGISSLCVKFAV
ncbi:hypothetical protein M758_UG150700 [Ceratodon purpureus]|nr:hypothetical protein M758_UG150700 [Ceratodon purpureus]